MHLLLIFHASHILNKVQMFFNILWGPDLAFGYIPDFISFHLLPNGLSSSTIGLLPVSGYILPWVFCACCFFASCLLPRYLYGWCLPSTQVSAHAWFSTEGCFLLSMKFRMTCASYCQGILNYIHHNNTFPACLLNYNLLTCP